MSLSGSLRERCQPVDLFDPVIRDWKTPNRHAVSVQKNIATAIGPRPENSVGLIGVADMEAQIEVALRVEPIQFIKSLWNLLVAKSSLGTKPSGCRADGVLLDQNVFVARRILGPELAAAASTRFESSPGFC
jgi:hypothetical protein